jgi:Tfp pilus assembly protein PilN
MMITINFASRNYRSIEMIRSGLIAGSIILAIILTGLIGTGVSLRSKMYSVENKLKDARATDEQTQPLFHEREQLVKDLTSMSGLLESRKFSWTRLLTSIEAVVPTGVALKSVEFNDKERTVILDGKAQTPEALRGLVVGLEKSVSFKDPFLKHQTLEKGSITFNVIAVYHADAGAGVAQGKR